MARASVAHGDRVTIQQVSGQNAAACLGQASFEAIDAGRNVSAGQCSAQACCSSMVSSQCLGPARDERGAALQMHAPHIPGAAHSKALWQEPLELLDQVQVSWPGRHTVWAPGNAQRIT